MMQRLGISTVVLILLASLFPVAGRSQPEQPSSCTQCHVKQESAGAGLVEAWRRSVHASNGISCHGCHGGDPTEQDLAAMDPEHGFRGVPAEEEIPRFCGECHPGVEEDYRASLHGEALGSGGPHCVTCHGSHAIALASLELINQKDCTRCHGFERAATIREALAGTDERIAGLDRRIRKMHRIGVAVDDLKKDLFDARNAFHRLFHSVEVQRIRDHTEAIQSRLKDIRRQVDALDDRLSRRRIAGAVVVCLLVLLTVLLVSLRRSYRQEETRGPP